MTRPRVRLAPAEPAGWQAERAGRGRPGAKSAHQAPPGQLFVPRDTPHSFTVTSTQAATALVITGPPQLDRQIAARAEPPPAVE